MVQLIEITAGTGTGCLEPHAGVCVMSDDTSHSSGSTVQKSADLGWNPDELLTSSETLGE